MKQYMKDFIHRGMLAAWGGPVVMAIVYGILGAAGVVQAITPWEMCRGILTVTVLAFVSSGITVVYQMEKLPLMQGIFIHGIVLYLDYLVIYLINGWLKQGLTPVLVFTFVFLTGYTVIWAVIYSIIRRDTRAINKKLAQ